MTAPRRNPRRVVAAALALAGGLVLGPTLATSALGQTESAPATAEPPAEAPSTTTAPPPPPPPPPAVDPAPVAAAASEPVVEPEPAEPVTPTTEPVTTTTAPVTTTSEGVERGGGPTPDQPGAATATPLVESAAQVDGPHVTITKSASPTVVLPGGTVTYTITVTNTGSVALDDIAVDDDTVDGCDRAAGDLTALDPGDQTTYTCTDNPTASVENTATVEGVYAPTC